MKKFLSLICAFMIAIASFCGTAFAAGSPTIKAAIYFIPAYAWTDMAKLPSMDDIEFAAPVLAPYFEESYTIYEAFNLTIDKQRSSVIFVAPTIMPQGKYVFILHNDVDTYYLYPMLISTGEEAVAVLNFAQVNLGTYAAYLIGVD